MAKHIWRSVASLALLLAACSQPTIRPEPPPEPAPKVGFSRPQGLTQALTVGETYDFDAALYQGDAVVSTAVSYQSDAPSVLEVDPATGQATARAAGDAKVTATSAENGARSAPIAVTVYAPRAGTVVSRQNAGGPEVAAQSGPPWRGDARNDPSSPWTCGGGDLLDTRINPAVITIPSTVVGPAPAAVYASIRSCSQTLPLVYTTTVAAAGNYTVRLHFAETRWGVTFGEGDGPGDAWSTVAVNGKVETDPLDVFVEAGGGLRALVKEYPVSGLAAGGAIRVTLTPRESRDYGFQSAFVSGVEVVRLD